MLVFHYLYLNYFTCIIFLLIIILGVQLVNHIWQYIIEFILDIWYKCSYVGYKHVYSCFCILNFLFLYMIEWWAYNQSITCIGISQRLLVIISQAKIENQSLMQGAKTSLPLKDPIPDFKNQNDSRYQTSSIINNTALHFILSCQDK